MTEQNPQPAPPRYLSVPQVPVPQTCSGVLHETGNLTETEPIADLPPDFGWMSQIELYQESFTMKLTDTPGSKLTTLYPLQHYQEREKLLGTYKGWHHIPFTSSKWWNGNIRIRLMAIKPAHVTGKLLLRYAPDNSDVGRIGADDLRRGIKHEWDLGMSSECVFTIPAYNVMCARPTYVPRISFKDYTRYHAGIPSVEWYSWTLPYVSRSFGRIQVEVANTIQPGSIYPDSIRILVFTAFEPIGFYTPTDFSNAIYDHIFYGDVPVDLGRKALSPLK
ncbi:putative capsid protein [Linepithema humile polycipivirus 2]|nr:putative capsid protein [Linepithema humile polycipivirus 2]